MTWSNDSNIHSHQKIYKSLSVFDPNTLPSGAVTIGRDVRVYEDTDVVEGFTYYYAVATVDWNGAEYLSDVLEVEAVGGDGDLCWDDVVVLLPMDEDGGAVAINEANSGPVVNLVSGATFSSSDSQFSSLGSLSLNGDYARAILAENPIQQGESFTIEAWVKITGSNTLSRPQGLWSCNKNSSSGEFDLLIVASGAVVLRRQSGAGPAFNITTAASTAPLDEWVHVAHTFDGSHQRVFINGTGVIEVADAHGVIPNDMGFVFGGSYIQNYSGYRNMLKGFMDEVRMTKGVVRYTGDFTPPTEPFPNYGV